MAQRGVNAHFLLSNGVSDGEPLMCSVAEDPLLTSCCGWCHLVSKRGCK